MEQKCREIISATKWNTFKPSNDHSTVGVGNTPAECAITTRQMSGKRIALMSSDCLAAKSKEVLFTMVAIYLANKRLIKRFTARKNLSFRVVGIQDRLFKWYNLTVFFLGQFELAMMSVE